MEASRQYDFKLLKSYWTVKKYFPESRLNLDTTFGEVAAKYKKLLTPQQPLSRQYDYKILRSYWQTETGQPLSVVEVESVDNSDFEINMDGMTNNDWIVLEEMGFY